MPSLTIIRGLPGSGKSTLAKSYVEYSTNSVHYEADMFFVDEFGEYNFDHNSLAEAHDWCRESTEHALINGRDVVVSNTFTTIRELAPYFAIAKKYNIIPNVVLCQGNFGSIHGVPDDVLTKMKNRFQHDISSLYN